MVLFVVFLFIILLCINYVVALNNGLARTPPMGWMSWGYYMCGDDCVNKPEKCLDENLVLSVADAFYNDGYLEAGYEYIIIDDCWSEKERDRNGRLVPDKQRFPNGMKYLADYVKMPTTVSSCLAEGVQPQIGLKLATSRQIHARGLKFGMYTNIAAETCMHYPGSRGRFAVDADTFAQWGVDYLKVDGCYVENEYLDTAYIKLGYYLNKTGRPMVFSCSWPYYNKFIHKTEPNYEKVSQYCNLWRNYHDVFPNWRSVGNIVLHFTRESQQLMQFHKPGQWNDPDMLVFGSNGLTEGQSKIQLALYAMWSAPLLISCDMTRIEPFEKKLLQNLDLIAIAQDVLGVMATSYSLEPPLMLYVKRHLPVKGNKYHSFSFALVNFGNYELTTSFVPKKFGADSNDAYTVMDVFTGVFLKNVTTDDVIHVSIPSEDIVLYSLFPL